MAVSVAAGVLARTALTFDGAHDGVTLAPSPTLSITGQITLESWVRPTATDGFRDILAHGPHAVTPATRRCTCSGSATASTRSRSWDGDDTSAAASIPAGDLGAWVHLAGTYDGNSWRLYRNGILLSRRMPIPTARSPSGRRGGSVWPAMVGALLRRRPRRRPHLERRPSNT